MKLANAFTTIRIVLAPVFFCLFFLPEWTGFSSAASVYILVPLFVFMEFTDFLDGYFARKQNTVSDFGKLYDPFADVLANLTVLLTFVVAGYLPVIFFLVILYREMSISFVRMLAAKNGVAIGARKGGKTKTVLYIIAAGASLLIESAKRLGFTPGSQADLFRTINLSLYVLAVIMSVVSFLDYLRHYSMVLNASIKKDK